jgi:hypothetical protein
VITLGDVDELKVHRKRPHDPLEFSGTRSLDTLLQPLFQREVVVKAEPLAQDPYLLFGVEESLALLLQKDLSEDPAEEVDVPPERFVFRLEADPGRQVSVLARRRSQRSSADIHGR